MTSTASGLCPESEIQSAEAKASDISVFDSDPANLNRPSRLLAWLL